jgi:hypothetical protein
MKPGRRPSPFAEPAMVSFALALIIALAALMAALPARRCVQRPACAPCAVAEEPDYSSLPVVVVAFASRFDSAALVGIGVEHAPFAQR